MTAIPESHRDLLDSDVATLATIDDSGSPQLTVVWFIHEDGHVKLSLNTARAKTRFLTSRPECALLILDLGNPYRYLELRGTARVEPDPDYAFADKVGAKYGANLKEYDGPGESRVVVTIEPEKIYPINMRG